MIIHTDRGSQYTCQDYRDLVSQQHFTMSMSRTGNCYDNAYVESLFRSLKVELVNRAEMKADIESIELILDNLETRRLKIQADIESTGIRLSNFEAGQVKIQVDIEGLELKLNNAEAEIIAIKDAIFSMDTDVREMGRDIYSRQRAKFASDICKLLIVLAIITAVLVSSCVTMILMK